MSSGIVPGENKHEAAARVAGALAELGVTRIHLTRADSPTRELRARETDLPGLIAATPQGTIKTGGISIEIGAEQLSWTTAGDSAQWRNALANPISPV